MKDNAIPPPRRPGKILATTWLILLLPACVLATRHTVCPGCPLASIQKAVETAAAGDTIIIRKGIYKERGITVKKRLCLVGEGGAVIDGQGQGEILSVFAPGSEVRGLAFRNVGVSYTEDPAAIRLVRCEGCLVADNSLENTFFGIYLQQSEGCTVRGNRIVGRAKQEASSGNAIHIWKGERVLVEDNYVSGHRDGIYFEFVDDSEIRGNTSEGNLRYGLHFMFSNRDVYEGNIFRDNGAGVAVMFSRQIRMLGNTFDHNWGGASYGILLKEISDGEMAYNTFRENTRGIYAEGANRLHIHHNEFVENGWALDVKGNCLDNRFEYNNFIANTFELTTNSRHNLNTYSNNYWGNYRGADLNRDGIGDVPYRPASLHALIIGKVPAASILLHSFFMEALDYAERIFPSLIPEQLADEKPLMKPASHDTD
ncbi:MAG: nitrous oxide reductase family maturation protein NosD [Phaeodactylibacter sp.]|nr:nitrous oxide reductase family maturation protein NosD [Phaeodactylibacter sp.]